MSFYSMTTGVNVLALLCIVLSPASALYDRSSGVVDLDPSNFNNRVINSDEIWIVEFYAPWCGHCQSLVPEYKKVANALKGIVKVGAVNADEHRSLGGQYGVKGFPTIKIFGLDKSKPQDYQGGRTASALVDAALQAAKSAANARLSGKSGGKSSGGKKGNAADVIELTDSNFDELVLGSDDMWLVEFFAPWCGHCKNLAPHWEEAATNLKGKVKLGALDATVHTIKAQEYGVQGFPTIKYFGPGPKDRSSAEDYTGGRTGSDIINWANEKLADSIPPPEVKQLLDDDTLKSTCGDSLCVVSILPHILDCQSECRNSYLTTLAKLGEKFKKQMWGWVWSEAAAQPDLEESLGLGGFGYPAMVVLSTKKMQYAMFKGSYSYEGINEFMRELSYGRGSTNPVRGAKLPTLKTVEPWDGKDGVLEVEEDIDLSDVELDDLTKDEL